MVYAVCKIWSVSMELKIVFEDGTEITIQDMNEDTWPPFNVFEMCQWRCSFLDLHLL